jgi:predicted phosphoribosyltransferase
MAVFQKGIEEFLNVQWSKVHREHSNDQRELNRRNSNSEQQSAFEKDDARKIFIADTFFSDV